MLFRIISEKFLGPFKIEDNFKQRELGARWNVLSPFFLIYRFRQFQYWFASFRAAQGFDYLQSAMAPLGNSVFCADDEYHRHTHRAWKMVMGFSWISSLLTPWRALSFEAIFTSSFADYRQAPIRNSAGNLRASIIFFYFLFFSSPRWIICTKWQDTAAQTSTSPGDSWCSFHLVRMWIRDVFFYDAAVVSGNHSAIFYLPSLQFWRRRRCSTPYCSISLWPVLWWWMTSLFSLCGLAWASITHSAKALLKPY